MLQERSMPQPRKYETRAEQQAAYRQRRIASEQKLLSQKGLPALPAIATMPGKARWSAMIAQAYLLLAEAAVEMQIYHDDRSPDWQESTRAEELLAKVEQLQETMEQLQGIE
jgi:hypothetical protein